MNKYIKGGLKNEYFTKTRRFTETGNRNMG